MQSNKLNFHESFQITDHPSSTRSFIGWIGNWKFEIRLRLNTFYMFSVWFEMWVVVFMWIRVINYMRYTFESMIVLFGYSSTLLTRHKHSLIRRRIFRIFLASQLPMCHSDTRKISMKRDCNKILSERFSQFSHFKFQDSQIQIDQLRRRLGDVRLDCMIVTTAEKLRAYLQFKWECHGNLKFLQDSFVSEWRNLKFSSWRRSCLSKSTMSCCWWRHSETLKKET